MLVCCSFGQSTSLVHTENLSRIKWTAVKIFSDLKDTQRMNANKCVDPFSGTATTTFVRISDMHKPLSGGLSLNVGKSTEVSI